MISIRQLFKYSNASEKAKFYLGCFCAVTAGVSVPGFALVVGLMFEIFNPHVTPEEKELHVKHAILISGTIAVLQFCFGWWSYALM